MFPNGAVRAGPHRDLEWFLHIALFLWPARVPQITGGASVPIPAIFPVVRPPARAFHPEAKKTRARFSRARQNRRERARSIARRTETRSSSFLGCDPACESVWGR